jgi:hypothetical protein
MNTWHTIRSVGFVACGLLLFFSGPFHYAYAGWAYVMGSVSVFVGLVSLYVAFQRASNVCL